jgi:hypothetical protein
MNKGLKMSKKLFRFKPSTYGKRGELLPKGLQFLKKFPYASIIEDQRGPRIELRVEIKAQQVKKIIAKIDSLNAALEEAQAQMKLYVSDNKNLSQLVDAYGEIVSLDELKHLKKNLTKTKAKNNELMAAASNTEASAAKSIKELSEIQALLIQEFELSEPQSGFHTFFNQKIKHKLKWPPLQGGAPGLKS